jgi:NAD(P)-dependent dehydrogenase (short-subunit alcohol dehydrogenase family)
VRIVSNDITSSGRVAVVVGGGGELGRATGVKLANKCVAVDRKMPGLEALPEGISCDLADVTNPQVVAPMFKRIVQNIAVPDFLVNTIGAFETADELTTTPDQFLLKIDVNLAPALRLSQSAAPNMQAKDSGDILHVSSRPGLDPTAGLAAHSVSNAALVHLTPDLDLEFRPLGIRMNAVAAQLINTARNRSTLTKGELMHTVTPEAIPEEAAFLASKAAALVTGEIVPVNGA